MTTDIDGPVADLVALFHDALADVSFPGVEAASLDAAVAAVHAAADEVSRLRRALDAAEDALREHQAALRTHARQAHAYARIYAADRPELLARLDALGLDQAASAAPKKRRGRRKKAAPQDALPLQAVANQ